MKLQTLNFIILTSAVVVFIGAGCGQTSKNKVTSSVNVGNQVVEEEGETAANLEEEAEETVTEGSVEEIDTSDWLKYENEEYGFSFRYPKDWNVKEVEEGGLDINAGDVRISNNTICTFHLKFPEQTLENQITVNIKTAMKTGFLGNEKVEHFLINDLDAVRYLSPVNAIGEEGLVYYFLIGDRNFNIIPYYGIAQKKCEEVYKNIINSIQPL